MIPSRVTRVRVDTQIPLVLKVICFKCGGAHFQRDCNARKSTGKQERSRPHLAKPDLAILIWPRLAKPNLANTTSGQPYLAEFGQFCLTEFGQTAIWPIFFCGMVGGLGGGRVGRWAGQVVGGSGGAGPKGWGPEGWGGPKGGEPKNSLFFSLSRHNFHSSLPLLGVLSWNFGGV